jgi:hypothetical protein
LVVSEERNIIRRLLMFGEEIGYDIEDNKNSKTKEKPYGKLL